MRVSIDKNILINVFAIDNDSGPYFVARVIHKAYGPANYFSRIKQRGGKVFADADDAEFWNIKEKGLSFKRSESAN